MPDKSLGNRGYTSEFLIDNDRFAVGANDAAWQETLRGVEENRADYESGAGRMIIRDETGQTVEKMSAFLHGLQGQGIRPRLIVVDYLQLIVSKGQDRVRVPEQEDEVPEAEAVNSKSFRIRKANIKIRQFTHMESEKGSIWVLLYKKEKFTCNGCIYVLSSFW